MTPAPYLVLDYDLWNSTGAFSVTPFATRDEAQAVADTCVGDVWEWQPNPSFDAGGHYVNLDG